MDGCGYLRSSTGPSLTLVENLNKQKLDAKERLVNNLVDSLLFCCYLMLMPMLMLIVLLMVMNFNNFMTTLTTL